MADELTVEQALKELRELCPEFKSRIITIYDPDPGVPYTSICFAVDDEHDTERAFMGKNLTETITRVRAWKEANNG